MWKILFLLASAVPMSVVSCTAVRSSTPFEKAGYIRQSHREAVLVFVHGIFGDANDTWTSDQGAYWPKLLTSDLSFDKWDIYVASYATPHIGNRTTIDDVVNSLDQQFRHDKVLSTHRGVAFIAHSLGGLVVQRYLITHRPSEAWIPYTVPFIYFFATPQTGSSM